MRTKALVCAAVMAAGLASSMAQSNVYSLNVVGYVNVSLQANKLHFLAIPLAPSNGDYGIFNTCSGAGDIQTDAAIYQWAGTAWNNDVGIWYAEYGWDPNLVIPGGQGFFMLSKANSTMTFVGEVPQSTVAPISYTIPSGVSTIANKVPTGLPFPGADIGNPDNAIYEWDAANQKWNDNVWVNYPDYGWSNSSGGPEDVAGGPALAPAVGALYVNGGAAIPFTRNFTVQ